MNHNAEEKLCPNLAFTFQKSSTSRVLGAFAKTASRRATAGSTCGNASYADTSVAVTRPRTNTQHGTFMTLVIPSSARRSPERHGFGVTLTRQLWPTRVTSRLRTAQRAAQFRSPQESC